MAEMHNGDLLREMALDHIDSIQREADSVHLASAGHESERSNEPGIIDRARRAVAGPFHAFADAIYPRECLE
jgi:hypothetical protein